MPNFTDLTGLASVASAAAASLLLLPGITRLTKPRLAMLLGAVFVLMLIPFGGIPLAAYVRGMSGDLSITTQALLWCALLRPWCDCSMTDHRSRYVLLIMIALAALTLYPMALGIGAFDPYRLGYGEPLFVAVLLLLALSAWFRGLALIALCIAFAELAWAIGWYESGNLWDYLLDPFVASYALATIIFRAAKSLLQRGQSQTFIPE
jgi:hypothetical protein